MAIMDEDEKKRKVGCLLGRDLLAKAGGSIEHALELIHFEWARGDWNRNPTFCEREVMCLGEIDALIASSRPAAAKVILGSKH
jgi:hypothetical protein